MNALRWLWANLKARPIPALLLLFAVFLFVGECRHHYDRQKEVTRPYSAPPAKEEERADAKTLPGRDVAALEPKPKDRERIAKDFNRPDLIAENIARIAAAGRRPAEIVAVRKIEPLPVGGRVLVTLEADGSIGVEVKADTEPVWSFRPTYEIGGMYGVGTAGDTRGRAWAAVEPAAWGRFHLRAEAGVEMRGGEMDGYLLGGLVWRSR